MARRSIKGKAAFVTGASQGIGRAIALRLANDGAGTAALASRVAGPDSDSMTGQAPSWTGGLAYR